jgi:hypothetical protein
VQILHIVVNVKGLKIVFAIVINPGPRTKLAVFGVKGGLFSSSFGSASVRGAAREPGG